MPKVNFIDTTLRDAQQSLWATRMTTNMMLPIMPVMDRIGFEAIDFMGAVQFEVCVRYLNENPWEKIRLARERVKYTPLNFGFRGQSFISFGLVPDDVIELVVKRMATNGIRRLAIFDGNNDTRNLEVSIRTAKETGMTVVGRIVYSSSPVHTDEHFAKKTKEMVTLGVDAVQLKDPSGLLTPDRTKTIIPAMRKAAGKLPLQLHTHCMTGLAPICLLEAIQLGVQSIYTAISPLANGASHSPTELMAKNVKRLGFDVALDEDSLNKMASHFHKVAFEHGKPLGKVAEYDLAHYQHQMPGGMISNFKFNLSQMGIEDRLEEILEETAQVREDLGWTIMVSPFSQHLATQAAFNVLYGRYEVVPDEVKLLALGHFGSTPGPINQNVLDKIAPNETPVTIRAGELLPPMLHNVRKEHGPFYSDDDLVLAAFFNPGILKSLYDSGPIRTQYLSAKSPLELLIREIGKRHDIKRFYIVNRPYGHEKRGIRVQISSS